MNAAARSALFYASPTPAAPGAPRLLLFIYNFPPDPAVGGLRWQELGRYFAGEGWAVDVVTRDFSELSGKDPQRLARLPVGVRVFCVPDREPLVGRIQKLVWPILRRLVPQRSSQKVDALSQREIFSQGGPRSIVRAYHAWMEFTRDSIWASAAASLGHAVLNGEPCLAIVSSGPPHMAHEAARLAATRAGIPHVVDMRDPWSLVQRLREPIASPMWIRRARAYESRIVSSAALVTMNTQSARDAMRAAYPESAHKVEVIRNGSDDEPLPPARRDGCFRIRFAGWIYMDRDPRPVFRAARRVIDQLQLTPDNLIIELVGHANRYANTPTTQIAEEEGVTSFVRIGGRMPRQQTMEFLAGATMLLSLPQDSDYAVPAKIYEYVRFPAWMLVLAMPTSATAEVLQDSDADVVDPTDVETLAAVLTMRYRQFARGETPRAIGADGRFDRRVQAQRLMTLITRLVERREPTPAGASPGRTWAISTSRRAPTSRPSRSASATARSNTVLFPRLLARTYTTIRTSASSV